MEINILLALMWSSIGRVNPALEPREWKIQVARLFDAAMRYHTKVPQAVDWACGVLLDAGSSIDWPPVMGVNTTEAKADAYALALWRKCITEVFESISGVRAGTCRRQAGDKGGRLGQFLTAWAQAICAYNGVGTSIADPVRVGELLRLRYGGETLFHQFAERGREVLRSVDADSNPEAVEAFGKLIGRA